MNKTVIGVIIVVIAVLVAGFFIWDRSKDDAPQSSTTNTSNQQTDHEEEQPPQDVTQMRTITAAEVAEHDSEDSCWTIIDNNVYDLTEFIGAHPGGAEILRACGTDGTSLFISRTTEDGEVVGSGTGHSSEAEDQLNQLMIGVLEQ